MAFDPNSMSFDQLLAQARADYQAQAARKGDDPAMGMTSVGGMPAQIYFGGQDPWARQNWDNAAAADPWANASFNYMDPAKKDQKLGTNLSRGADGSIKATDYRMDGDMGFLKDMAMFGGAAFGLNGIVNGLAGLAGSAGASGASGAAGTAASGAGETALANVAADQLPNEMAKLLAQNAAAPGSLLSTALPTVNTLGGASTASSLASNAKTALDVARAASTVNGLVNGGAKEVANQTVTQQNSMDPRMNQWIYGDGTAQNPGLLSGWMNAAASPQNASMQQFGNASMNYLGQNGAQDMEAARQAAYGQMNSGLTAPQQGSAIVANTPGMQAAQINAPSQNNLDLSSGYNDMIYGQAGNNPYLTGAIQKGINQSSNAFGNMVSDATKATQGLLGDIRGGAIVNGQMGSSRQGIAEGKAIDSFNTQIGRAASQFGQNNTDAAVAAQAGAYDADRNRALSAMQGLSGNQYNTATQNAAFQQQANQTNYQGQLQGNLANAGFQQSALNNNLQSQLNTQALNSQRQQYGIGATQGLLSGAYGYGTNQDAYGLNRASQQAGLLSPFTGLNSSSTSTQPLYQNKAGNIAAGVTAASAGYDILSKLFG